MARSLVKKVDCRKNVLGDRLGLGLVADEILVLLLVCRSVFVRTLYSLILNDGGEHLARLLIYFKIISIEEVARHIVDLGITTHSLTRIVGIGEYEFLCVVGIALILILSICREYCRRGELVLIGIIIAFVICHGSFSSLGLQVIQAVDLVHCERGVLDSYLILFLLFRHFLCGGLLRKICVLLKPVCRFLIKVSSRYVVSKAFSASVSRVSRGISFIGVLSRSACARILRTRLSYVRATLAVSVGGTYGGTVFASCGFSCRLSCRFSSDVSAKCGVVDTALL